jgi:SAM-dependent methyltransferase
LSYEDYEIEKGWTREAFGRCNDEDRAYFGAEISGLALPAEGKLRILELGFGNGRFLAWAVSEGHYTVGVEINERLVHRAKEHGFHASTSLTNLADDSSRPFDLIAAFDVLEHIDRDHLIEFLRQLRPCAHEGTRLLFRFPNADNPFALYLQNGDLTHRTAIGSKMIRQIAELAGYHLVAVRRPVTPLAGASLLRRVKLLAGWPVRLAIGLVFRYVFMGGERIEFSANLVAVLKPRDAKRIDQADHR